MTSPQIWTALDHAEAQHCLLVAMGRLFAPSSRMVDKPRLSRLWCQLVLELGARACRLVRFPCAQSADSVGLCFLLQPVRSRSSG